MTLIAFKQDIHRFITQLTNLINMCALMKKDTQIYTKLNKLINMCVILPFLTKVKKHK